MSTTVRRVATGAICLVISFVLLPRMLKADTLINFDDVKDKTDIRTHYQSRGVIFACEGDACSFAANANGVYARATSMSASAPNGITPVRDGIPAVADALTGRVAVMFTHPVSRVSIDALTVLVPEMQNQTSYANMLAYDAKGSVVASATCSKHNAYENLKVSARGDIITKVSLGVTGNLSIAAFDNLRFDSSAKAFPWVWIVIIIGIFLVGVLVFTRLKHRTH